MISQYSIVQYLPNPTSDERINVGVVAFDDAGHVGFYCLKNWERVKRFSNEKNMRSVQKSVEQLCAGADAKFIETMSGNMNFSIQLTSLRASSVRIDELVPRLTETFLVEKMADRNHQSKMGLKRRAFTELSKRFDEVFEAGTVVVDTRSVTGKVSRHPIDVTATNGKLIVAAPVISLAQTNSQEMRKQIGEAAWAIQDIGASKSANSLAVLVAGGNRVDRDLLAEVVAIFPQYGAQVIQEKNLNTWTKEVAVG